MRISQHNLLIAPAAIGTADNDGAEKHLIAQQSLINVRWESSSASEACAVARSDTPQYAALRQAPASSGSDISSIAMSSGDMQRRRIMAARAFGQSDSTSVRSPISNPQLPTDSAAISPRVAKTDTHSPIGERPHHITQQRCFPAARRGGSGWKETDAQNLFPIPFTSRGIRIHGKEIVPIPKAALAAREPPAETNTDTALRRNEAAAQTIRRRIGGCAARKLQNAGEIGRRYSGRIKKRMFSVRQSYRRKPSAAEPNFTYF